VTVATYPENYEQRLTEVFSGACQHIHLFALDPYDLVLAQLERNPAGLKMNELSRRLMVTGGNVTGLTDQLEKEGFVVRDIDPNDRRSFAVRLTAHGRESFDRMARAHEQWVVELFGGLPLADKARMHQKLGKLKQHLRERTDS